MKFSQLTFIFFFVSIGALSALSVDKNTGYLDYHKQITEAERLISSGNHQEALSTYQKVFNSYDFVFLRDYLVAAQLSLFINNKQLAFSYIKEVIAAGLEIKKLKKNKFFQQYHNHSDWKNIEKEYDRLRATYLNKIDQSIRDSVHVMFKKDQSKALGALFRIGDKAQEKYATKKFAPHSETQMIKLIKILENHGYPGEKLIGNNYWMSTIISHHNSISQDYSKKDTIYRYIRPKLLEAIKLGQMSPFEFAMIDDWYKAVISARTATGYGFLSAPNESTLFETNGLRQKIGLRTIALRNKLVETEKSTGMNFYLPDWVKGEISIDQK